MELKWLEDFISLANTGSFSQAAENRNVTQSAFSRRIMALESWLGTRLIDRKSHPIKLTQEGIRFIETAEQSVNLFHKVRNDFSRDQQDKQPQLTIGISDHLASHFFPTWLKTCEGVEEQYFFDLKSSIKSGLTSFESLKLQKYDFLICYRGITPNDNIQSDNFISLTLGQEYLVPVASATLIDEKQLSLDDSCSDPLPYITYEPYSFLSKAVNELATLGCVSPINLKEVMKASSAESIKSLALQGYGIAWLPESAIKNELADGRMKLLGDNNYHIALNIEIHRYTANTKPEILSFWQTLLSKYDTEQ